MKTSVLDFIDSKTLRQHLSGQTLAPAVECILIAQSRYRSLNDKLRPYPALLSLADAEGANKGISTIRSFYHLITCYFIYSILSIP